MTAQQVDVQVLEELRVGVELDAAHDPLGAAKLAALDRAIASLRQSGEAVAVVMADGYPLWLRSWLESSDYRHLPAGTKLYTAQPATSGQDRAAIRMLVAAGFVTEAKANEALSIAHGFAAGPLESVASDQIGEDCGCRQGRGAGGPLIPYTCEKHRVPTTSGMVEALRGCAKALPVLETMLTVSALHRGAEITRKLLADVRAALAAQNTGSNGQ